MARIYINSQKAGKVVQSEAELSRLLHSLSQDVYDIRGNLRYKIAGREQISARLRQAAEQIERESNSAAALSTGLQQATMMYQKTEVENRERLTAEKTSIQPESRSPVTTFDWGKLWEKVIEKGLGPLGFITGISGVIEGESGAVEKILLSEIGTLAKAVSTTGETNAEWALKLFGLAPKEFTSFKDSFFDGIGKFDTPANTIATAANWGTKFVDSFVKNNEEFSGDWCARFWEETVVETGVKVAESAAITAGVSALFVALGVTCPPALLVGVAAAGVGVVLDWGLDTIVSWATNGSCTSWIEGVSDIVCNEIDTIREEVGTIVTKAGEVINSTMRTVTETGKQVVNSISNGVKNLFSGCSWSQCLFAV